MVKVLRNIPGEKIVPTAEVKDLVKKVTSGHLEWLENNYSIYFDMGEDNDSSSVISKFSNLPERVSDLSLVLEDCDEEMLKFAEAKAFYGLLN